MKLNEKLCKLLDKDEKGYITLHDMKNSIVVVVLVIYLYLYSLYIPIIIQSSHTNFIDIFTTIIAIVVSIVIIRGIFLISIWIVERTWNKINGIKILTWK